MLNRIIHTIQGRILMLGLAFLIAMLVNGFISQSTIETVRVNGYVYDRIMAQKDLYIDLAPPPLNVVRSTLLVTGIARVRSPSSLPQWWNGCTRKRASLQPRPQAGGNAPRI